jgi:muconolactone D-isomerase
MEFLVQITLQIPPSVAAERVAELFAAERKRGRELQASGTIQRIWRIPGSLNNAGIWQALDATELHDAISSLPMFPFMQATVTPLAVHPLESKESQ